ncbi:MAG: SemiSWEET family sugar transporter [Marinilabiliaceae bacterium]|nr:SemiSWEET family sugar transporter [Marinilabiliaceae bacterium]
METIEIFGYLAAVLTTLSFVPQAVKTIRTKNTQGISLIMYLSFSIGVFCWLIYGIAHSNLPIILANGITLLFALIILYYKIQYK